MNFKNFHFSMILAITCQTQAANADFKNIAFDYIDNNIGLEKQKLMIEIESFNYNLIKSKNSFSLSLESQYSQNKKAQNSFLSPSYTTSTHNLTLTKNLSFGGNISIGQNYSKRVLHSSSASSSSFFDNSPYNMESSLIYSQDLGENLFGRSYRKDLEISAQKTFLQKIIYDSKLENGLYKLANYYVSAQMTKKLIILQREAIKRALHRKRIIGKRVKDGLLDEVDLLEVTQLLMKQEEAEQINIKNLNQLLQEISNLLHRHVNENEILVLNIDRDLKIPEDQNEDEIQSNSKNLEVISANIQTTKKELEKIQYALSPKVSIYTGIKTNDIGDKKLKTLSESMPGNPKKEVFIGLKATYPLGQYGVRAQREQLRKKLISFQSELIKTEKNINITKNKNLKEMELLKKLANSTSKRRNIAKKNLKLINRLYDLGKRDIEFLINGEENLINVEKNLADVVCQFKREKISYFYINGQLSLLIFSGEPTL